MKVPAWSLLLVWVAGPVWAADVDPAVDPAQIFERRILPIFKSPDPSSCTQCHLAGVDIKNYILPSHEKTFLSLRDQGLIDLAAPASSKILKLIQMGDKDKQGSTLILDKVRQAEYQAFAAWIKASCEDPKLREAPKLKPAELAQAKRPVEVIRHARGDRLLASFEKNIWAQRFRCMGCHLQGGEQNAKLVRENGERMNWIKPEGAEATMQSLIAGELLDTDKPDKSLLLRKPLVDGVKHGGGKKMLPGDLGYKAFRTWIEDYAAIVNDRYAKASDLPKEKAGPKQFGSRIWLKLERTPAAWSDRLLQITAYAWDANKKSWEKDPIAISDREVSGKAQLWQHNLILLADGGGDRARDWAKGKANLPPGKYLLKVHVDTTGALKKDWTTELGKREYAGQIEIESRWPEGYGNMTVVNAGRIRE